MRRAALWRAVWIGLACCGVGWMGLASGQGSSGVKGHTARIAILGALPPLTNAEDAGATAAVLKNEGFSVALLTPAQLADTATFNAQSFDLFIVPHADTFPALAQDNLLAFLHNRGKLLCIGGPAFSRYAYADGRQWKTRDALLQALPDTPLLDLGAAKLASWTRATNIPKNLSTLTREDSPHGPALHFRFSHFTGWDNFGPPPFAASPFAHGATALTFWAKGSPQTRALVIEWKERDGSRWIGTVKLATSWRRYVMTPDAFRYWTDSTSKGRGGSGDSFRPANAKEGHIGLAQSHVLMNPGTHEFWFAAPGSVRLPDSLKPIAPPNLESLSPGYKVFRQGSEVLGAWVPILRQRGIGLMGQRPGRLMTPDPRAGDSGYFQYGQNRQWVYLSLNGERTGAFWGGMAHAQRPGQSTLAPIAPMIRRMTQGVYLVNAGADRASYFAGQLVTLGAQMVNVGKAKQSVRVEIEVSALGQTPLIENRAENFALELEPNGEKPVRTRLFPQLPPGEYSVTVRLFAPAADPNEEGELLDAITEPFRVLPEKPTAKAGEFVRVRGGEFVLNGKPWRPVGVNYWPLWVAGEESPDWLHWLAPDRYDPELVEKDLVLCEQLGVNLLSIQYASGDQAPALNDFLARCRNHRLKVNVFVEGANPLEFPLNKRRSLSDAVRENKVRALLNDAHLKGNPTVFAFDVAWEPHVGLHTARKRLDADWLAWIREQYGSLANAEKDWGMMAPREGGKLTNPSDEQLSKDGRWRILVAAYRRFLDDRISRGYNRIVAMFREQGALVGARSGYGGNGSISVASQAPFDLLSGAMHLDFLSPEGYALSGAWPEFRSGGLTTAYARWAGNGKPVFWAEFGQSVTPDTTLEKIASQGNYYDKVFRLILDSGANGSAAWWFPGGLRIDENSDFGIIGQDGLPRPAAKRLQRHAKRELPTATVAPTPNAWITIDRDSDARGYAGVYEKGRGEYAKLRAAGEILGVRTPATGLTTATMPLMAVGNIPANGHNPLKYANAEIEWTTGDILILYNTGDVTWTKRGLGHVELMAFAGGKPIASKALPRDVERYEKVTVEIISLVNQAALRSGKPPDAIRLAIVGRRRKGQSAAIWPFGESIALAGN